MKSVGERPLRPAARSIIARSASGSRIEIGYALAKERNCPLLYVGYDFSPTDIVSALYDLGENSLICPPMFAGRMLDQWAYFNSVELDFSRPGKSTDNSFIESLNARVRAECLNASW